MSVVKRSATLYTGHDINSHRVRLVLAEKAIAVDIIPVEEGEPTQDFLDINPAGTTPTFVDRDLVLTNAQVIMEYLDERFPHPPMLPVYPVARAKNRMMIHHMEEDWYPLVKVIEANQDKKTVEDARKRLCTQLMNLVVVFSEFPFFMSPEFSMADCCIVPLLWRLPNLGIQFPDRAKPILDYAERMFERDSFQASMTSHEHELRECVFDDEFL